MGNQAPKPAAPALPPPALKPESVDTPPSSVGETPLRASSDALTPPLPSPPPATIGFWSIAPPPPPAAFTTPGAASMPRAYGWDQVGPMLGISALLLGGGVAVGVNYGLRQAEKVEEIAEIEAAAHPAQPKKADVIVTPEMRRFALRKATSALGLGTVLCGTVSFVVAYAVCKYWDVSSPRDLNMRLDEEVGGVRMRIQEPLRVPERSDEIKAWFGTTWLGGMLRSHSHAPTPSEQAAVDQLVGEAQRADEAWRRNKAAEVARAAKPDATTTAAATRDGKRE